MSDPATANNVLGACCDPGSSAPAAGCSHNNAVTIDGNAALEGWNKDGKHHFQLRNCTIGLALDAKGVAAAAADPLVGGRVESTDDPRAARIVDLDPSHQTSSQIWGLGIRVTDRQGETLTAVMDTATLRELWSARAPTSFARGFGGVYQSVLTGVTWQPRTSSMTSPVLAALSVASPNSLSIKLVLYAYDHRAGTPDFRVGRVVGTIGPARAGEPAHFVPDRRVVHAGSPAFVAAPVNNAAFGSAPVKVDAGRGRLVVDLGNALAETAPAGARQPVIGTLEAHIVHPKRTEKLGTIAYDTAHFLLTAGVEEVPLSAAQVTALATRPLRLKGGASVVFAEHPAGVHVDVTETVVRLNPGETADIDVVATKFGRPLAGAKLLVGPSHAGGKLTGIEVRTGPAFATRLSAFPATVKSGADGRATLRLVASDPGHPRQHVDGQVSFLGVYLDSATTANLRGEVAIRVFDPHPLPAKPTWADVQPILLQYFRLYPSMRFLNLSDHATVQGARGPIAAALQRPETDPGYMPVSRDLSRDKKALLIAWLNAGAP